MGKENLLEKRWNVRRTLWCCDCRICEDSWDTKDAVLKANWSNVERDSIHDVIFVATANGHRRWFSLIEQVIRLTFHLLHQLPSTRIHKQPARREKYVHVWDAPPGWKQCGIYVVMKSHGRCLEDLDIEFQNIARLGRLWVREISKRKSTQSQRQSSNSIWYCRCILFWQEAELSIRSRTLSISDWIVIRERNCKLKDFLHKQFQLRTLPRIY